MIRAAGSNREPDMADDSRPGRVEDFLNRPGSHRPEITITTGAIETRLL